MLQKPKISIITISFNAYSEGLENTIKSVIAQKNTHVEYLVIDGGSTDLSHDLYKQYRHHFDYFISEKDAGISDAFNKGVKAASGDYIWFINAGDYLNGDAINQVLEFIKTNKESIIYGDMFWLEQGRETLLIPASNYERKIKYVMPFLHPSTIVSKKIFFDVGYFDLNLKRAMDYDLLLRSYLASHKARKIDYPLAYMVAGGVHDSDYLKTLKEVRCVSVKNGGNYLMAYLALVYTYLNKKSRLFCFIKEKVKVVL
ncbi:glycosyltransferase family 2 protein [Shewanella sp. HN-41]|uniref:glycosyltransferase family 2 protein n=1 Tax=Shewanella sp. HN-41 TaxID=327275 RepID=UPI0002125F41|nr:glycosyltransferase family 2 protein [Shewanella sp. HN-41]EGM69249.1 hypothetical protein SOHN41_02705 [Shewanella sp. HN-41]